MKNVHGVCDEEELHYTSLPLVQLVASDQTNQDKSICKPRSPLASFHSGSLHIIWKQQGGDETKRKSGGSSLHLQTAPIPVIDLRSVTWQRTSLLWNALHVL